MAFTVLKGLTVSRCRVSVARAAAAAASQAALGRAQSSGLSSVEMLSLAYNQRAHQQHMWQWHCGTTDSFQPGRYTASARLSSPPLRCSRLFFFPRPHVSRCFLLFGRTLGLKNPPGLHPGRRGISGLFPDLERHRDVGNLAGHGVIDRHLPRFDQVGGLIHCGSV